MAIKQQEKAQLDEAAAKMDEEMKLKTKDGIKIAKGVLESRKNLKGLKNEHATACQRVKSSYKSYQNLKKKCPF